MPNWIDPNTKLNFEQRVLSPSKYPHLTDPRTNQMMTHLMSWGDYNGKYIAFPTIIYERGKLYKLEPDMAFQYAIENNQYRMFDTPEDAENYTTHYKEQWGMLDGSKLNQH